MCAGHFEATKFANHSTSPNTKYQEQEGKLLMVALQHEKKAFAAAFLLSQILYWTFLELKNISRTAFFFQSLTGPD